MKKLFLALIAAAVLYGGYLGFDRIRVPASIAGTPTFAPKGTLDGTRTRVKKIEQDAQKRADDLVKGTAE